MPWDLLIVVLFFRQNKVRYLVVKDVDKNSPAQKAGIVVGDYITKVTHSLEVLVWLSEF